MIVFLCVWSPQKVLGVANVIVVIVHNVWTRDIGYWLHYQSAGGQEMQPTHTQSEQRSSRHILKQNGEQFPKHCTTL